MSKAADLEGGPEVRMLPIRMLGVFAYNASRFSQGTRGSVPCCQPSVESREQGIRGLVIHLPEAGDNGLYPAGEHCLQKSDVFIAALYLGSPTAASTQRGQTHLIELEFGDD